MDVGSTSSQSALPRSRRRWRIPVIAALAAAGVFGGGAVVMAGDGGRVAACVPTHVLRVAVAPELAPVVEDAAAGVFPVEEKSGDTCVHVDVVAADPADVARAITAQPPDRPDVWIPDASLWLDRLREAGVAVPSERPSVATSPAVLAISHDRAKASGWPEHRLSFAELLGAASTRLALRDPMTDAATDMSLVGLMTAATELPEGRTVLAQVLRHAAQTPMTSREELLAATTGRGAAAVSEQAVLDNNRQTGSSPVVAVYPSSGGSLDYPFTVLTHNAADARSADRLLRALKGDDVKDALLSRGFRDGRGVGRPDTARELGVDVTVPPAPVSSVQLAETLRTTRVITSGTRMLAVIDVSGSMAQKVPGADGATRMEVTKEAAARGMSLYPDDAQIGLWVFSRRLTPASDYKELVPIGPLGPREGGWLGRELLGRSLAGVRAVPDGDTGLYDTLLAAVRTVRQNWDPTRVNSVVLLTDGRDDDEGGIGLPGLLSALRRESDPGKPVPVITIALGSGSDTEALAAISHATGGSTYVTQTGDDIYAVFEDAIGRRSCRPHC
jgi:Mg-chelatase subunit ChlD